MEPLNLPPRRTKIAVVGVGGVGGYFGARLSTLPAEDNVEVWLLGRPGSRHTSALMEKGLKVLSVAGDVHIFPCNIVDNPADIGPCDYILVCLKTYDLEHVAPTLLPLCKPDRSTAVIPLCNGITAPTLLLDKLGDRAHILGGLCGLTSSIEAPGVVKHTSGVEPGVLVFGELDGSVGEAELWLRAAFIRTGIPATAPNTGVGILGHMWKKMCIVSCFGGAGALTRQGIGYILGEPRCLSLYRKLAEEGVVVACACGHGELVEKGWVEQHLRQMATLPKTATSSMQRDLLAGRPSELHEQIGAMVCHAEKQGVEAPTSSIVYAALLLQENAARERADPAAKAAAVRSLIRTASTQGGPAAEINEEGEPTGCTSRGAAVSLPVVLSPRDEANVVTTPVRAAGSLGEFSRSRRTEQQSERRSGERSALELQLASSEAEAEALREQLDALQRRLRQRRWDGVLQLLAGAALGAAVALGAGWGRWGC